MQIKLPVDPGVVLLDIGFTGDDPNHGEQTCILMLHHMVLSGLSLGMKVVLA